MSTSTLQSRYEAPLEQPTGLEPPDESQPRALDERARRILWQRKFLPAFWTTTSVISIIVNIILIAVLIALGRYLFFLKNLITDDLVGGLNTNFIKMDDASIITTITVSDTIQVVDTIPVVFDLPLAQNTVVSLVEDTPIQGATVYLNGSLVPLYGLMLPKGTDLYISLDLIVPVNTRIPVTLNVPIQLQVPVNIPLDQTELHEPFVGLQEVVGPYDAMLVELPSRPEETPFCGPLTGWFCKLYFAR